MSIKAMKQAYAVPLIEQLESVPTDARMMYEHDKFHHQNIPVGRLCHEAATALRQAIEQAEKQEPALWFIQYTNRHELLWSKPKWVQEGVLEIKPFYAAPVHASDISQERVDETAKCGREWVGLTDEEIEDIYYQENRADVVLLTQAKLKEKNT